nr:uncharacterized protein LOC109176665 [Ipomoea batatas]
MSRYNLSEAQREGQSSLVWIADCDATDQIWSGCNDHIATDNQPGLVSIAYFQREERGTERQCFSNKYQLQELKSILAEPCSMMHDIRHRRNKLQIALSLLPLLRRRRHHSVAATITLSVTGDDCAELYYDAVGGHDKKRRMYGLGSYGCSVVNGQSSDNTSGNMTPTSRPPDNATSTNVQDEIQSLKATILLMQQRLDAIDGRRAGTSSSPPSQAN